MYFDPREGAKRNWAAAEKRIHEDDDNESDVPKDIKSDFSQESANEDNQDRPRYMFTYLIRYC